MKIFSAFITILDSIHCVPLLPIYVSESQQLHKLSLDKFPQFPFRQKNSSTFFQRVQEKNDLITNIYQLGQLWEVLTPQFKCLSEIFKFYRDICSCISPKNSWRGPTILYNIKKPRMIRPKILKSEDFTFGIEVPIITLQGMWSEMGFAIGKTSVFGYMVVQLTKVKNQSRCSKSGFCCMFLQVNALPLRGSSIRPDSPIASLKTIVSEILPPGLFLFSVDL